jgi:hypothetical protein
MRKSFETEHQLKMAIRDCLARNPLTSVLRLQADLQSRGFKTANGNPLDWRYVSKMVHKVSREGAIGMDQQKIQERLLVTKERYRLVVEKLWHIIDYKWEYLEQEGLYPPKTDEMIKAMNTLLKLDLAILKAEMDAGIFERKLGTVDVNMKRATPLEPEQLALVSEAFARWGLDLSALPQRPKQVKALNAGNPE